jgi:RNA polymerase sigma-70 factor (ECF subfamily)
LSIKHEKPGKLTSKYKEINEPIIEKCKRGDRKAQYKLYQLYSKAMFNICLRMTNSAEEAEDRLQEAFTEAFMKLDSFRYESAFGAWLKRIVINKCINEIKRRKADLLLFDNMQEVDPGETTEEVDYEEIKMNVKQVQKAIECLPEGYRIIFSLYLLEGYDHGEIAQIMDISESTSKSQYMRAKQKIKNLVKSMQS